VWSSVWGWLKNTIGGIPHAIMSFLHMSPPHPGSAFYDLGANMMHHLEAGMRARVQSIGLGTILGGMGGAGGTVTSWITSALRIAGKPMAWLPALQRLVSLESGGNPRAVNPIAVLGQHATGLWQMLPSTAAAEGYFGSLFNPILEGVAALRYISSRYGSPYNIPGLFTGGYRGYDRGGWLPPGLTLAMNATGRPERILPPGAGGTTFNIHVNVPVSANKADVGRQVVEAIREYEMRSGAGWRK
jgi:hypothetical protein